MDCVTCGGKVISGGGRSRYFKCHNMKGKALWFLWFLKSLISTLPLHHHWKQSYYLILIVTHILTKIELNCLWIQSQKGRWQNAIIVLWHIFYGDSIRTSTTIKTLNSPIPILQVTIKHNFQSRNAPKYGIGLKKRNSICALF